MNVTDMPTGPTSVEDLIRYAANRFAAAGIEFRPPRMTRLIRRAGVEIARSSIDAYLVKMIQSQSEAADRDRSWDGFERYALTGYADPTPAYAHRNLVAAGWYQTRGSL